MNTGVFTTLVLGRLEPLGLTIKVKKDEVR